MKSIAHVMAAYDEKFSHGGLRDADSFYRWVLQILNPPVGSALLDVACGEGHLLRCGEMRNLRCYGLDLSSRAVEIARENAERSQLLVSNGEALPFADERFDYVTCLGSLEHFFSPKLGLFEIKRVLRQDGLAGILLPNSYYLMDIIWQVWRTGYGPTHHQVIERFASFCGWRDFLESGGLRVLKSYKYNFKFPRSLSDIKWYVAHPRKILNLLISPFFPFNLSYSFLFICTKSPL